ncbi:MAG: PEP-CTERM sorting domain-containing protein [Planctomycetota bacterium]
MRVEFRRKRTFIGIWLAGVLLAISAANAGNYNLELRELLPAENPAARNVYVCRDCSLAEFVAAPLPGPNWEKNATATSGRLFLPDSETNIAPVLDPSVPTELDLIPTIPGPDHFLTAKVLSAEVVGFDPVTQLPIAEAQVARGTTMQWNAGRVIHKSISPTGEEYVLFSIDETYSDGFDINTVGGMDGMPLASGWTYGSELLDSEFVLETPTGIANVLLPGGGESSWQRIVTVPEPSSVLIAGLGLIAICGACRRTSR